MFEVYTKTPHHSSKEVGRQDEMVHHGVQKLHSGGKGAGSKTEWEENKDVKSDRFRIPSKGEAERYGNRCIPSGLLLLPLSYLFICAPHRSKNGVAYGAPALSKPSAGVSSLPRSLWPASAERTQQLLLRK